MLALLQNPEQLARLRSEPQLIGSAVEEILRYDSPVQRMGRVVAEEVSLREKTLKVGDRVFMVMGAANREPCAVRSSRSL